MTRQSGRTYSSVTMETLDTKWDKTEGLLLGLRRETAGRREATAHRDIKARWETTERTRSKKRPRGGNNREKRVKITKESDPLALYFKQISRYPLLTVQDEQDIGEQIVN